MSSHIEGHSASACPQPGRSGFAEHNPRFFCVTLAEYTTKVLYCQFRLAQSGKTYGSITWVPGTRPEYHMLLQVLVRCEERLLLQPDGKNDAHELDTFFRLNALVPFKQTIGTVLSLEH